MSPPAPNSHAQRADAGHWRSPVRWQVTESVGGSDLGPRPLDEAASPVSARAIRLLNLVVAILGMIFTAPLFIAIAVLVKLSSPGPVFYVQERVGLDRRGQRPAAAGPGERRRSDQGGRIFRIYKFRTMVADSDRAGQVWASRTDPRITAVGHVLRKYRLDELPQLVNVLKGDMNIVGPRPEQPKIFQELREKVTRYEERQRVLPGITGLAQVNHSYDQCIEDVKKKVEYDLKYIEQRSFLKDLRIMARTVPVMIGKKGSI
jgi:lipopolysaccharide/colanic/teichoic acid biosynthesis glycosyltransferase